MAGDIRNASNAARDAAAVLGHDLTQFQQLQPRNFGAQCVRCGRALVVTLLAERNVVVLRGLALELPCVPLVQTGDV